MAHQYPLLARSDSKFYISYSLLSDEPRHSFFWEAHVRIGIRLHVFGFVEFLTGGPVGFARFEHV